MGLITLSNDILIILNFKINLTTINKYLVLIKIYSHESENKTTYFYLYKTQNHEYHE